jgi:hypothetical protein
VAASKGLARETVALFKQSLYAIWVTRYPACSAEIFEDASELALGGSAEQHLVLYAAQERFATQAGGAEVRREYQEVSNGR